MYIEPLRKKSIKKERKKSNQDFNGFIYRAYCAVNYTIYPFLRGEG